MKKNDKVYVRRFPQAPGGVVHAIDGREVTVRYTMGSGWPHYVGYDIDDLDIKKEGLA